MHTRAPPSRKQEDNARFIGWEGESYQPGSGGGGGGGSGGGGRDGGSEGPW